MVSLLIYAICLWAYVFPYLSGEEISIPPGHKLIKGKDDWSRGIGFVLVVIVCLTAILSPAGNELLEHQKAEASIDADASANK